MHVRRHLRLLLPATLGVLLAACLVGLYVTGVPAPTRVAAPVATQIIDQHLLQTAHQMAVMADTAGEQSLAGEALRLADHELDQAFASALREVAEAPPPSKGPLKQLSDRIAQVKLRIAADQDRAAKVGGEGDQDEADLAKAQLALDRDELEDLQEDLARQGGDPHARLQQALQEHDAAQHDTEMPKVASAAPAVTLAEQFRQWSALESRGAQLHAAGQEASNRAAKLSRDHEAVEQRMSTSQANGSQNTQARVANMRHMSDAMKTAAEYDKRVQDCTQLADVYRRWESVVDLRRRGVLNQMLRSFAVIIAIVLAVVLIDRAIRRAFRRQKDARRLHQLRVMATAGVQVVGVVLILLVIFGLPSQTATLFGLVTAGLTVALKDFIVAFFGWFVLMGKNGIRIGDWVEINGVGGEVIELGLLKTVLLEMGNWTSTGHPTGRQVSFVNSFALEGHYFNFSTAGHWLWDELEVTLPLQGDPYGMAEQIRQTVESETDADARLAEQEWERVTHQYGTRAFSARPAMDIRPAVSGLNVAIRYITRGPQRYEVKSRLFEAIVNLLHKPLTAERRG